MIKLTISIENFVNDYVESLLQKEAGLFVGAGLSFDSGMPSWKELLRKPALSIGLDVEKEEDLVTVAQYFVNESNYARTRINKEIKSKLKGLANINNNQKILAQLPIDTIWTTNYDNLLERAFEENGKIVDVKRNKNDFTSSPLNHEVTFYKMHGDVSNVNGTVITRREYEEYDINFEMYVTALKSDLVRKTFLFIGYSFQDPNLRYILSQIRLLLGNSPREHYFFIKKIEKNLNESEADFKYRENKQNLQIKDLERYNIKAVEIDSYNQISDILNKIKLKVNQNHILISSAQFAQLDISHNKLNHLLAKISYELVKEGNVIVNGYGWNSGNAIIKGALMAIMEDSSKRMNDYLKVFPFPQPDDQDDRESLKIKWTKLRNEMIDNCGIAIFVSGNKNQDGTITISNGMIEEFEISKRKGVVPVPVGQSGGASKTISEIVSQDYNLYYKDNTDLINMVSKLNEYSSVDDIVSRLKNIILTIQK